MSGYYSVYGWITGEGDDAALPTGTYIPTLNEVCSVGSAANSQINSLSDGILVDDAVAVGQVKKLVTVNSSDSNLLYNRNGEARGDPSLNYLNDSILCVGSVLDVVGANRSMTVGYQLTCNGINSFCGGLNSIVSSDKSFVWGSTSQATGVNSLVLGNNSLASNTKSKVLGDKVTNAVTGNITICANSSSESKPNLVQNQYGINLYSFNNGSYDGAVKVSVGPTSALYTTETKQHNTELSWSYNPLTPADWSVVPNNVGDALDTLASSSIVEVSETITTTWVSASWATTHTASITAHKSGSVVTLDVDSVIDVGPGTGDGSIYSDVTQISAQFRPSKLQNKFIRVLDDAGFYLIGMVQILTTGQLRIYTGPTTASDLFTNNTSLHGFFDFSVTYPV